MLRKKPERLTMLRIIPFVAVTLPTQGACALPAPPHFFDMKPADAMASVVLALVVIGTIILVMLVNDGVIWLR